LSVVGQEGRSEFCIDLDELVCEGARRMLAVALEEEVAAYIAAHASEVDERGHRLVRRNGHARQRMVTTGAGPVPVAARGWMTAGSTRRAVSGFGSGR
jgi:putative transposase